MELTHAMQTDVMRAVDQYDWCSCNSGIVGMRGDLECVDPVSSVILCLFYGGFVEFIAMKCSYCNGGCDVAENNVGKIDTRW